MNLDLRTIFITSSLLNFALSVYLTFVWIGTRKEFSGIFLFVVALFLSTLGNLGIGLQQKISPLLSIVFSNFILLISIILIYISLFLFFYKKMKHNIVLLFSFLALLYLFEQITFTFIYTSLKARIILTSIFSATPIFFTIMLLIKNKMHKSLPGILLLISFSIPLILLIIRIPVHAIHEELATFLQNNTFDSYAFLIMTFMSNAWPFGFTLLISEKLQEREKLQNREKTALLHELYHRTKNNMQVISSFLNLQRNFSNSQEVKEELLSAGNRIKAISLVHEHLYKSKNLSSISLNEYIIELANIIVSNYFIDRSRIIIEILIDNISVSLDTAVSVGLVVNELLTNSVTHGFSKGEGRISIKIKKSDNDIISGAIEDNGVGVQKYFKFNDSNTLGLQTIKNIIEYQLSGKIRFESKHGFSCFFEFKNTPFSETTV